MTDEEVQIGSTDAKEEEAGTSCGRKKIGYSGPEIRGLQERDSVIGTFVQCFPKKPKENKNKDSRTLKKQFKRLVMKEGILYRRVKLNPGDLIDQLVLPEELRRQALYSAHEEMGLQGIDRKDSIHTQN